MNHIQKTLDKMAELEAEGYKIIEGNNPFLNRAKKYREYETIKICQTNSRRHGRPINTVWAIKKKG